MTPGGEPHSYIVDISTLPDISEIFSQEISAWNRHDCSLNSLNRFEALRLLHQQPVMGKQNNQNKTHSKYISYQSRLYSKNINQKDPPKEILSMPSLPLAAHPVNPVLIYSQEPEGREQMTRIEAMSEGKPPSTNNRQFSHEDRSSGTHTSYCPPQMQPSYERSTSNWVTETKMSRNSKSQIEDNGPVHLNDLNAAEYRPPDPGRLLASYS